MRRHILIGLTAFLALGGAQEPAPRQAVPVALEIERPLDHVSSAAELPDGRLVAGDALAPAVWIIDPVTGATAPLGSVGVGRDQYVQPGGLYGGADDGLLLLDRAQLRVMVIDEAGRFSRTYSVAIRGTTMATDADIDLMRLDARGNGYFADRSAALWSRARGESGETVPVVRLDPATQQQTTVAQLGLPETRHEDRGGGLSVSRSVIGSPADGWGVAPDGSIAVVRGSPYRVEWIAPDGAVNRGPIIEVDAIPMTDADKAAYLAAQAGAGGGVVSVGTSAGVGLSGLPPEFTTTKAPFEPEDVVVSPDSQAWVRRTRPAGASTVVYDVFDRQGSRIDRLEFPASTRVVGFGRGVVYVVRPSADGPGVLSRYERR